MLQGPLGSVARASRTDAGRTGRENAGTEVPASLGRTLRGRRAPVKPERRSCHSRSLRGPLRATPDAEGRGDASRRIGARARLPVAEGTSTERGPRSHGSRSDGEPPAPDASRPAVAGIVFSLLLEPPRLIGLGSARPGGGGSVADRSEQEAPSRSREPGAFAGIAFLCSSASCGQVGQQEDRFFATVFSAAAALHRMLFVAAPSEGCSRSGYREAGEYLRWKSGLKR